jgi:hypothetical protein
MPSHFSSLGFPLEMDTPYQERLLNAALSGDQLRSRDGAYVRWTPGAGVELWLQVQAREVIGLAPHFAGEAIMRVALTERVPRPEESPLAGAFYGWANPPADAPDDGEYPFVFDLPDAGRFAGLALPCVASVQLAAFAQELRCFPSEAAFDASQGDAELKYAAESFIPTGTFVEAGIPPTAYAMFTSRVVRAQRRVNPFSGGAFWWLCVATLGGQVDVVADPLVVDGEPMAGGIAQGSFWLSGRLPSALADSDRAFWRRWLPV